MWCSWDGSSSRVQNLPSRLSGGFAAVGRLGGGVGFLSGLLMYLGSFFVGEGEQALPATAAA